MNSIFYICLKIPYALSLFFLKIVCKLFWKIEIWPRHSYLTQAFIPGKSDLDLSIYIKNETYLSSFLKFYNFFKKILPFLGEINIYRSQLLDYINTSDVNGFEITRDPVLISRFNLNINKPENFTREKAISFLFMALINDLHKLTANQNSRIKKWRLHFEQLQINLKVYEKNIPPLELNEDSIIFSVLTAVALLAQCKSDPDTFIIRSKLRLYLNFVPGNNSPHFHEIIRPLVLHEDKFLAPYFIEYISFFLYLDKPLLLPPPQFKILCAQIDWVVFRLLKQNFSKNIARTSIESLNQFKIILNKIKNSKNLESCEHLNLTLYKIERGLSLLSNAP